MYIDLMNTHIETVTYTIEVPVIRTWATGAPRGTGTKVIQVEEESTVLGGARAINAAVAQCDHWYEDKPPTITPNPAELGWPIS